MLPLKCAMIGLASLIGSVVKEGGVASPAASSCSISRLRINSLDTIGTARHQNQ